MLEAQTPEALAQCLEALARLRGGLRRRRRWAQTETLEGVCEAFVRAVANLTLSFRHPF